MDNIRISFEEQEKERDRLYPNRHTEIHKDCCKKCPSDHNRRNGIIDEETEWFKKCSKDYQIKEGGIFVCAWRPSKLCKGACDDLGITEEDTKVVQVENNK